MEATAIISSGILELYVASLASEQEVRQVKDWLLQYPEVGTELASIEIILETYAQNFTIQPTPIVKEKIVAQINGSGKGLSIVDSNRESNSSVIGVSRYWRMVAATSIALLICSVGLHFVNYNKQEKINYELVTTRQALTRLEEKEKHIEGNLSVIQSKYSVPVALKGLDAAPEAAAKIFWMKNTGEVFIDGSNLPVTPPGKRYQLWGIVDGKPVDGGMLLKTINPDIFSMQKMKSFGKAEAFAITLEPENGNATPQGPMYVMGKM